MSLDQKTAIVTGAGGGLGRSHALYLAARGVRVLVNDISIDAADQVASEIGRAGGTALPAAGSVTDEAAVGDMVKQMLDAWGRVDILINNAGILRDRSFTNMTMADFRDVLDVHVVGAAICTKAVWGPMREQKYGRVVMTTSSSGLYGNFGQANYAAAKMALVGLMQTLAIEGEKYNIRVNCLAPTAATQMTHGVLADEALRMLAPERVSPALLPLVGDDAPTRTIVCAGAGNFAAAYVTLTQGAFLGDAADDRIADQWDAICDRSGDIVPDYGFMQAEREVAAAKAAQSSETVAAANA